MGTYCECGDVATRFYNDDGDELQEPCCDECWHFQCIQLDELFSGGALIPTEQSRNSEVLMARSLRLAVVQNQFDQGNLTEDKARELLSGPLTPGDDTTIVDDSDQLTTHPPNKRMNRTTNLGLKSGNKGQESDQ